MKILAVNSSSTALQFLLVDTEKWIELAKGSCTNIGSNAFFKFCSIDNNDLMDNFDVPTHREAVMLMFKYLTDNQFGVVSDCAAIDVVGHRVAHGGEAFRGPVLINKEIVDLIKSYSELAPMDNPINMLCISVCREILPNTPMVAVFDTSFHSTIPDKSYLYSIPYGLYENYGVRRYGFRGSSHKYVSKRLASYLGLDIDNSKAVICHLGSETSICAVKDGKSVECSTGFTPMSGVGMGTRSGDMDPYIVSYLAAKMKVDTSQIIEMFSRKSGLLGLSNGLSSDIREIERDANGGNELAEKALEVYSYNIAKAIGASITSLNGADAIAFTAGVGENSEVVRRKVCSYLTYLGVFLDEDKNSNVKEENRISRDDSKIAVCVIATNEELEICRDSFKLISNMKELYRDR